MPDLGDKVGDVYVEVHAEVRKGTMAKAQKELEASALKAQKGLNAKLAKNAQSMGSQANNDSLKLERNRIKEMNRLHTQAISEDRRRTVSAQKEQLKLEKKFQMAREKFLSRKRYKDGGIPGLGESFENAISILPGQLEKLSRNPVLVGAAVALGGELIGMVGAGFAAAAATGVLAGGIALAIKADPKLQEAGKEIGVKLFEGLQDAAHDTLAPLIRDAFKQVEGSNFSERITGDLRRAFFNVGAGSSNLASDLLTSFETITSGIADFTRTSGPLINRFGDGIKQIGNSVAGLFHNLETAGPGLEMLLGDLFNFASGLITVTGKVVKFSAEFRESIDTLVNGLQGKDLRTELEKLGGEEGLSKTIKLQQEFIANNNKAIAARKAAGATEQELAPYYEQGAILQNDLNKYVGISGQLYTQQRAAALNAASANDEVGQSAKDAEQKWKDYTKSVDDAIQTNKNYNDSVSGTLDAQLDWANGIADLKEQFKGANDTISLNSKRGRENRGVLLDRIEAAREEAQATLEQTHSAKEADKKFKSLTDKILSATGATGKNREAIEKVIGKYKDFQALPEEPKEIKVKVDATSLNGVKNQLSLLTKDEVKTIFVQAQKKGISVSEAASALAKNKATGGPIFGPGTATSDSIPANLSNGEFVIKASSAKSIGYGNLARMNSTGKMVSHFATGGVAGNGRGSSAKEKSQYEALLKQIATLNKTITAQSKALEAYNNQLSASREQFKSFVNLGALDTEGKKTGDILQQLQQRKAKATSFTSDLGKLKKKGLSAGALQQIADAGPDSEIAKLVLGGSGYDIRLINSLLGGATGYSNKIADTIFPKGKGTKAQLEANKKRLAKAQAKAKKLRPVKARGATISYAGGRTTALFSSKELQQQQLKAGTYVTVVIDGKEVRAIVKEEQRKTARKANRQVKSGRK